MEDTEKLRELEQLQNILDQERIRSEFIRNVPEIEKVKPRKPKHPSPPKQEPVSYTHIPYPAIEMPDFGMSPWYRVSLISLLVIAVYICLFFLTLCTPASDPILSIPYAPETIASLGGFCGLLAWFAVVSFLIGFLGNDKRPDRYQEKAQASPEYIRQCQEIDALNAQAQKRAQAEAAQRHQQALHHYNTSVIPEYNKKLQEYHDVALPQWEELSQKAKRGIQLTEEKLANAYAQSPLPHDYRNLEALEFIVPYMETSHCGLQDAIKAYELKRVNELFRQTMQVYAQQTSDMQEALEDQQELIEQLGDQLDDTNESIKSQKRWNMASTALAGYAAYKSRKIGKQIDEKGKK